MTARDLQSILCSVVILSTTTLAVCRAPEPRLVCAEFFDSQVVVEAKLVRSTYVPSADDADAHIYEMQTEKVLHGAIGKSFQIWERNDSGRASFVGKWMTRTCSSSIPGMIMRGF